MPSLYAIDNEKKKLNRIFIVVKYFHVKEMHPHKAASVGKIKLQSSHISFTLHHRNSSLHHRF